MPPSHHVIPLSTGTYRPGTYDHVTKNRRVIGPSSSSFHRTLSFGSKRNRGSDLGLRATTNFWPRHRRRPQAVGRRGALSAPCTLRPVCRDSGHGSHPVSRLVSCSQRLGQLSAVVRSEGFAPRHQTAPPEEGPVRWTRSPLFGDCAIGMPLDKLFAVEVRLIGTIPFSAGSCYRR